MPLKGLSSILADAHEIDVAQPVLHHMWGMRVSFLDTWAVFATYF
jgi:hypothetical protein